ncbi:MAG: glycerol-3-phosphate dehydrogenase C-terminal domain-containing protein, partial [Streptosporangiaceae bacterium]
DYLLAKVNHMLSEPLTAGDIEGVFAGLRPLVAAGAGADTTKLSREHTVRSPAPGLSVIAGGKYTTYRVMARDLIDVAARDLTGRDGRPVPASRTHEVPLRGANGYQQMWEAREQVARSAGLPVTQVERLLGRYGSDLTDLLALMIAQPALKEPAQGAGPYLGAEIVYACSHEGAVHLDDVLSRRTRIRIEVRDRGAGAAHHAAELMAAELGWDQAWTASEIGRYQDLIAADLAAEAMPDDLSAFEAARDRLGSGTPSEQSPPIPSIQGD